MNQIDSKIVDKYDSYKTALITFRERHEHCAVRVKCASYNGVGIVDRQMKDTNPLLVSIILPHRAERFFVLTDVSFGLKIPDKELAFFMDGRYPITEAQLKPYLQ